MKKAIGLLALVLAMLNTFGQASTLNQKGKFFSYWGWNRGWYTSSDIHFTGDNYDFTLKEVKAKDRQSPFSFKEYFNPVSVSIPQTNFRLGYYLKDDLTLTIGFDHMKYVVTQYQVVDFEGEINEPNAGSYYQYNSPTIPLNKDFLQYEHTDGLNYVNSELAKTTKLFQGTRFGLQHIEVFLSQGFGLGIVVPRTDATLFGQGRSDRYHLAGYGINTTTGINVTFFKYFFVESNFKAGYLNMFDVQTTLNPSDKATQKFGFIHSLIG